MQVSTSEEEVLAFISVGSSYVITRARLFSLLGAKGRGGDEILLCCMVGMRRGGGEGEGLR